MPLETGSFVNDLTVTNPAASDAVGQGDDHLRLIKSCVQGTFPQMGSVLGQVRRQDTALSISSTWNTNHFICSASATATVVLTAPPAASITAGFYFDVTTIGTGTVSLLPSGASSINGGVSLSIPQLNSARVYYVGSSGWLADVVPHGNGGYVFGGNATVNGTLSVSGAAVFNVTTVNSTLSVSGAAVFNAVTVNGVATLSAAVHMKSTLSISGGFTCAGTATISATLALTIGQIAFPSTQVPNAGANVLDDYEEGTWTPVLTFSTPGNLSVTYGTQAGNYTKVGRLVNAGFTVLTSSFTHTTASGVVQITGFPFTSISTTVAAGGVLSQWQGINGAGGRTAMAIQMNTGSTLVGVIGSGDALTASAIAAGQMPTGGTVQFVGNHCYFS